ncbi:MAG: replication-associated recombination protein A [Bacteriovoracaceae bacterium]
MQLDVFNTQNPDDRPLAARLRPASLADFYGQSKIRPHLENLLKSPRPVIFWGPPGTGKTTLAHLLAQNLELELFSFNAVTSGIPELKKVIAEIFEKKKVFGKQSILFIDEIHRFNKSQQDALLPYLENGDFIFVGATTEYPHTSLNKALISRVMLLELTKLSEKELVDILTRASDELKRTDLLPYLPRIAELSNGDARFALNQLSRLSTYEKIEEEQVEKILDEIFEFARQYDRNAQRHYEVISAFIKSIRGSDPDAALLYLAVMLDGGEDPEFIARRLMILASEDIGLANSQALQVTSNAHYVTKHIGMPEARITLSHATVFLALAPKSNSVYQAINSALSYVENQPTIEVPPHLKNIGKEAKNYKYPHSYSQGWVEQIYQSNPQKFYLPKSNGSEKALNDFHNQLTKKHT